MRSNLRQEAAAFGWKPPPKMIPYKITVADNGVGIPPEQLSRIFERFHQAANTSVGIREGAGLGLAITRQLVQLHGGRIWAESVLGQGSRFAFTLPIQRKSALAGPA